MSVASATRGLAGLDPDTIRALAGLQPGVDVMVYPAGLFVPASSTAPFPGRPEIISAVVDGDEAGAVAVPGIKVGSVSVMPDDLVSVVQFASGVPADLTGEFTVSDDDEIDNTGGTDTTGDKLLVLYSRQRGYTFTGLDFPTGIDTKAAMPLFAPASWASVDVNILALGEAFGSGTVRFQHSDNSATAVEVEVAGNYVGQLFTDFTMAGTNPTFGQFAQLALTRVGSHANDDLNEGVVILAVYLTEGS